MLSLDHQRGEIRETYGVECPHGLCGSRVTLGEALNPSVMKARSQLFALSPSTSGTNQFGRSGLTSLSRLLKLVTSWFRRVAYTCGTQCVLIHHS